MERVGRRFIAARRDQAPQCPGPSQGAILGGPKDQAPSLDADPVPRRELGQVIDWQLHGTGDVEDRLVAVAKVVGVAHDLRCGFRHWPAPSGGHIAAVAHCPPAGHMDVGGPSSIAPITTAAHHPLTRPLIPAGCRGCASSDRPASKAHAGFGVVPWSRQRRTCARCATAASSLRRTRLLIIDGLLQPCRISSLAPSPKSNCHAADAHRRSHLLRDRAAPAPSFPADLFGPFWSAWLADRAKGAHAPADYVTAALLASTSALLANVRRAQAHEEWREATILWCAIVGEPSSNKSPGMRPPLNLLRGIEEGLNEDYPARLREYETKKLSTAEHRKRIRNLQAIQRRALAKLATDRPN